MSDFIRYFIEEMAIEAIELTCVVMLNILKCVPGVQGVDETVHIRPHFLAFVPDRFKIEGICNWVMRRESWDLKHVPNYLKDQGVCEWVVHKNPRMLKYATDYFKT